MNRLLLLLALPILLAVSGCDRQVHDDLGPISLVEVRDRETGALYAFYQPGQAGDQWQGGVPPLVMGQETVLEVRFFDIDGQQVPLSATGEYHLGVRLATPAEIAEGTPEVVAFTVHADHVVVVGTAPEASTYLVFQILHGSHSDFDARALRFEIVVE